MNLFSYKSAFFSIALLLATSTQYPKAAQHSVVKITFASQHIASLDTDRIDDEVDYQYCLDALKELVVIQKTRKLSLEEMVQAFKIVNFMIKQYDQDPKKVEIALGNGDILVLPYSICAYHDMTTPSQAPDNQQENNQ